MERTEFSQIRRLLGKTQTQLSRILCVSPKAIQSFEQGWRPIPAYIERELLLLVSMKNPPDTDSRPCWETHNCPEEWRSNCIVWELQAMNFCWFLNGTYCQGQPHKNWADKIDICRQCDTYRTLISPDT